MQRQALDDGSWFDVSAATRFREKTHWDGHNHISVATGGQWAHEALHRTRTGRWILNRWSDWEGAHETWEIIADADAARWLICNGHEHADAAEAIAALEV